MDRKVIILESIIREYLNNPVPVSSKQLRQKLRFEISSATIRNYFKKMVEEGVLEQIHISSGRIPTNNTLKTYWKMKLPEKIWEVKDRKKIGMAARKYKISCEYRFHIPNRLLKVINYENKFIVLSFENGEFVVGYNEAYFRFFNDLIQLEAGEILKIFRRLGLLELAKKIDAVVNQEISVEGVEELIAMIGETEDKKRYLNFFLNGDALRDTNKGVYFEDFVPKGYLAYMTEAKIEQTSANFLCVGKLKRDFETFFEKITQ